MDANSNLRFFQTEKSSRSPKRHRNSHADAPVRISVNCEEGRAPGSVASGTRLVGLGTREEKMRQRVPPPLPPSAGSLGSLGTATAVAENNSVVSRWVMCVCVHSERIDSVYRRVCDLYDVTC